MFTLFASHDANGENGLDVTEVGDDEKDGIEVEPSLLDVLVAKIPIPCSFSYQLPHMLSKNC